MRSVKGNTIIVRPNGHVVQVETIARNRQIGQFILARKVLHNSDLRVVRKIMANFIVLEAKKIEADNEKALYLASSHLFRECAEDEVPPMYEIHVTTGANGSAFVRVEELKNTEGSKSALEGMQDVISSEDDDESIHTEE
tara:strand:+ start:119 stop:538 length:420 start_codon:yes stop_codon:yes gene_type:complete